MFITFERYEKKGAHGDRSTTMTIYYDYAVKLHRETPKGCLTVARFTGYDQWWTSVKKQDEVLREAENFVDDLADIMDLPRPKMATMVRKQVMTEKWVEEES